MTVFRVFLNLLRIQIRQFTSKVELRKLQKEQGFSFLFIAHDLSMVKFLCNRTGVMYHGKLVEEGTTEDVFSHPDHEYTKALLAAIPVPDPRKERNRRVMKCYEG